MPNKTIYISDKDESIFVKAQKLGDDALSAVIVRALKEFIARKEDKQQGMSEITVKIGSSEVAREQRFVGQKVAKWQGTSDDKVWWMEAVIYKTQKDNWAVWLSTVGKAEVLIHGARNWMDWVDSQGRSELLVEPKATDFDNKLPQALYATLLDVAQRDQAEVEYLDI